MKKMWELLKGPLKIKTKNQAKLFLINFTKVSDSKEILKIGRSELFVLEGGELRAGLLNLQNLYTYI